ncbi:dihydroneopterin aldolase [Haloferula sp. A504]|uniref:dihydroneopterin aldolase n=1 Tax=Haloferula sp. A504 TaxID=3373601 RepID=UPI0031BDA4E6|nr:dihydroneopterin aldolase [Verrucomicrobiaceae bacterium E54]
MNRIHVRGLEVETRIGVPDEERAEVQLLKVDLEMTPAADFAAMGDEVSATIDYHQVCLEVCRLAGEGERKLIETLASEIADLVIDRFGAVRVRVRIRKFILPETEWVGVECVREA